MKVTKKQSKIAEFWGVSESHVSKFSSTMVKIWLKTSKTSSFWGGGSESQNSIFFPPWWRYDYDEKKTVKLCHSEGFQKVKFQNFLQPLGMYDQKTVKLSHSWDGGQKVKLRFFSTMMKVWLRQKNTLKLGHSEGS